ncbi:T9SS type A sorting domain-containing protein [candidate division TA06 bacterium]|uniref:T9SS type A sorting domain-containing protein n=1 Tax=candidate division TA06 bacterium TaxID=2250710 RepID=A0A933IB56_UNCT6|nr:T9SS type A sorting domain-containing protein [candidate division TA06 bacterium]
MKKLYFILISLSALSVLAISADIKVNSDTGKTWQGWPAIAAGEQGTALMWQEDIADSSFLYLQCLDTSGVPIGINIKLDSPKYRMLPAIIAIANLGYAAVWMEIGDSSNGWDIYGQLFNATGDSMAPAFKVNDDSLAERYCPDIVSDSQGNFTVVWMDSRNQWTIYGQRYSASGSPVSGNIALGDSAGCDPKICMKPDGNFAVTWQAETGNILWRRFDSTGNSLSNSLRVNSRDVNLDYAQPVIAVNDSGNYCLSWNRLTVAGMAIMAQFYDSTGTPTGINIVVNEDTLIWGGHVSVVPVANNHFVIGWTDERDWVDNYCQCFYDCNQPESNNLKISSAVASGEKYRQSLALASAGNNLFAAWMDLRDTSTSWDIYARKTSYQELGVEGSPDHLITPGRPVVNTNVYPNPSRTQITFSYSLQDVSGQVPVSLKIYNICGQKINEINEGLKTSGTYGFKWGAKNIDSRALSAGIYFYRLTAGKLECKGKFVVLK